MSCLFYLLVCKHSNAVKLIHCAQQLTNYLDFALRMPVLPAIYPTTSQEACRCSASTCRVDESITRNRKRVTSEFFDSDPELDLDGDFSSFPADSMSSGCSRVLLRWLFPRSRTGFQSLLFTLLRLNFLRGGVDGDQAGGLLLPSGVK